LLEKEGHSDYALSRYDAGRIFAAFLLQCAKEAATHPEQARLLRAGAAHLAVAYKAGNDAQRRCVVDGLGQGMTGHEIPASSAVPAS